MLKIITFHEEIFAIIVRSEFSGEDIRFFTPSSFSQQLAYMHHPVGKMINPHVHNPVDRNVTYTNEVLFLKKGKLRVDFYDEQYQYMESYLLKEGDLILLVKGGHGFEVIEEIEMIEVKQGPFAGDNDKTRFTPVDTDKIIIKD